MVKYVMDMWSPEEGLPVSRIRFMADLTSVGTSKLPSSTLYVVKRRHSSGGSGELRTETHVTGGRRQAYVANWNTLS